VKKFFVLFVLLAALVGGGWWYWSSRTAEAAEVDPATIAVTRGTVESTVLASGTVEARTLVSVGARVSGQVEELAVALGDEVGAGDLVAQIDNLEQQNTLARARADLKQIEAQIAAQRASMREAELSVTRTTQLNEKSLASDATREAAEAAVAVARANLDALLAQKASAEISVAAAELDLERTRVTAPVAGTVVAVVTSEGQTLNAAQSSPTIVKLADLDRMVIKAEISEADVVRVKPGQTASFTLLGEPEAAYEATVSSVEPAPASIAEADEIDTSEAIYFIGRLDVGNPDRKLRIGMTAQVRITLDRASDVLTVLSSVLGPRQADGTHVVEVWDAATRTREDRVVTVGLNNNVTAEIVSGLAEGELVVADRTSGSSAAMTFRGPRSPLGF
jgi:macrolide-specific efflux system membrane fusion protein